MAFAYQSLPPPGLGVVTIFVSMATFPLSDGLEAQLWFLSQINNLIATTD